MSSKYTTNNSDIENIDIESTPVTLAGELDQLSITDGPQSLYGRLIRIKNDKKSNKQPPAKPKQPLTSKAVEAQASLASLESGASLRKARASWGSIESGASLRGEYAKNKKKQSRQTFGNFHTQMQPQTQHQLFGHQFHQRTETGPVQMPLRVLASHHGLAHTATGAPRMTPHAVAAKHARNKAVDPAFWRLLTANSSPCEIPTDFDKALIPHCECSKPQKCKLRIPHQRAKDDTPFLWVCGASQCSFLQPFRNRASCSTIAGERSRSGQLGEGSFVSTTSPMHQTTSPSLRRSGCQESLPSRFGDVMSQKPKSEKPNSLATLNKSIRAHMVQTPDELNRFGKK